MEPTLDKIMETIKSKGCNLMQLTVLWLESSEGEPKTEYQVSYVLPPEGDVPAPLDARTFSIKGDTLEECYQQMAEQK